MTLEVHLNALHFPLYFEESYSEEKMSMRTFSCMLQVRILWIITT